MFRSGEGIISYNEDELKVGNRVSFTIVPENGWYLKSIRFNDTEEGKFDTGGTVFTCPPLIENSKLYVSFSKISGTKPAVAATPYVFKTENDIFFIGRLFRGSTNPKEYGILLSHIDSEPDISLQATKKIKALVPAGNSGFFGFQLTNRTGEENIVCYIRPYAIYDGEMVLANKTTRVALNDSIEITDYKTYNQWLIHNMLEDAGIIKYIIDREGKTE